MIGTGNKAWVQLIKDGGYRSEADLMAYANANHAGRSADDFIMWFKTGLPLELPNGLHLHVDYVNVYLAVADTTDYLNDFTVLGKNTTSTTPLYSNSTNYTTAGLKSYPTGVDDWGDYDNVLVGVNVVAATIAHFQMSTILARVWYA